MHKVRKQHEFLRAVFLFLHRIDTYLEDITTKMLCRILRRCLAL